MDYSETAAIREAQEPRTKTSLRRFLDMTGFYRKYISKYAKIAAPLTRYLKEDILDPFQIDEEVCNALCR